MTRTRYGVETPNQSTEVEAVSRLKITKKCRSGIIDVSSEVNNVIVARSSGSDTETENCYKTASHWHVKKTLQLSAKSNSLAEKHFLEACFNETSKQHSCSKKCDGVYRSFTGCCNNLVNTEYGQISDHRVQSFECSWVLFHYRKNKQSTVEAPPSSLWVRDSAQRGTSGQHSS